MLRQIGIEPAAIDPAEIDETARRDELPAEYVMRIAAAKAEAVRGRHPGAYLLAADTAVAVGRRTLPKAEDPATARRCLELLSGRRHKVLGGIVLVAPDGRVVRRLATSAVIFKRLDQGELDGYLATGEWDGKAGGYAIQGSAAAFIRQISGSYSNVVGLSLFDVRQMLVGLGHPAPLGTIADPA